ELRNLFDPLFEKVEENQGFINFYIDKQIAFKELEELSSSSLQGSSQRNKKILVEFTDPNPFKEFHVGHLLDNIIGESLARMMEFEGAHVKRANYEGDVGMHVAKCVWGILQLKNEMPTPEATPQEKARFLGKAYAFGASKFDDEIIKKEITKLNKKIYEKDPEIMEIYQTGRAWSLEYFELIYKRLGTKFDFYYFESEIGKAGLTLVKEYLDKGIFKESEGAIIFPGEQYGLHTRVFVNSLGLPTYEAKELGLAPAKYNDFKYDLSIILTGNEVKEYFKVLLCALQQINPDLASKTRHLSHGMVRNADGSKMSSRSGNVLTGEMLLDEAKQHATKIIDQTPNEFTEEEKSIIAEEVGKGAIKYAFLKSAIGKDIAFDMEQSVSFHGDAGPYLQYTYARCMSILRKAPPVIPSPQSGSEGSLAHASSSTPLLSAQNDIQLEELNVLKLLIKFPEIVAEAADKYSPHILCSYLFTLTQSFNTLYEKHPILKAESDQKILRLKLTETTSNILKQGLHLLGIEVVEKI
ncbi:MAG TPA: arginine--tRNA ligase, partial [Candidatus Nitrosocosmicus sp.]|nr:arginine--tRNA ligase [Candidatus Nitrosocosmicus sp.]